MFTSHINYPKENVENDKETRSVGGKCLPGSHRSLEKRDYSGEKIVLTRKRIK